MQTTFSLGTIDWVIILIYFVFVLGIGWALKRYMKDSKAFLEAGRSLPAWVTGLAFISANLGALEMIGMSASGAKYGMVIIHHFLIGAIPAMIFLAIFMMPFYYGSKARSVPEYLKLRETFGPAYLARELRVEGFAFYIGALVPAWLVRVGESEFIGDEVGAGPCSLRADVPAQPPGLLPVWVSQYGGVEPYTLAGFFHYGVTSPDCIQPGYPCSDELPCCATDEVTLSCREGRCRHD